MILTKESLYLKAAIFDELLSDDFESVPAQKKETELGAKRLAAWCHAASGGDWNLFSKRLKRDNLKYNYVLTRFSSAKISQKIKYPQWVEDSLWIQTVYQNKGLIPKKVLFSTKRVTLPFESIFFNLVNESLGLLKASVSSKALSNFSNTAVDDISYQLLKSLSNFLTPYFFEGFSKHMKLANKKKKRTSTTKLNENYNEYIAFMINNKGIINSFFEKPVMLRMIATITRQWINTNKELISRIEADQPEINKKFKLKFSKSNNASKIISDLSDPHNSGHTVQILELQDRNKLVYKPKDCGLDFKFAELIEKLNSEKGSLDLRVPKIISKKNYGWSEYINHTELDQGDDGSLFFKRAGAWLSLFHNFSGTDMHFENIIASGNHPVPIDIEMILQGSSSEHLSGQKKRGSMDLANTKSLNSVMSVGLLPSYLKASDNQMIDIGGLSHRLHQPASNKCININTDEMKFVAKESKMKVSTNLPHKKNKNILFDKHTEIFLKGYQQYSVFLNNLFKNNGLSYFLKSFKSHSTRKVIKPTRFYATLIKRLKSTSLMDDGIIWSADLDFVSRLCDWNKEKDSMWPSIRQERIDLSEFNIPVFYMGVDSKKIINPRGYVCKLDSKSGFQQSLKRFKLLSEDEIRWQSEIIKISTFNQLNYKKNITAYPIKNNQRKNIEKFYFNEAQAIAKTIKDAAIRKSGSASWLCINWIGETGMSALAPVSFDLYGGSTGIGLYLAAFAKVAKSKEMKKISLEAIASVRDDVSDKNAQRFARVNGIGGASGIGSIIYGLTCIGEFIDDEKVISDAKCAAKLITKDLVNKDKSFDVIAGSAGAILSLLKLFRHTKEKWVLDKAIMCGEYLLSIKRTSVGNVSSWVGKGFGLIPHTGISHGASGFAYAFSLLAYETKRQDFKKASKDSLDYDNFYFNKKVTNWPKVNTNQVEGPKRGFREKVCQWCYGAPGVGLSRFGMKKFGEIEPKIFKDDINKAIQAVNKNSNISAGDSLCCGRMGQVEFLTEASFASNDKSYLEKANNYLTHCVENSHKSAYQFGGAEDIGLHLNLYRGIAGVGYTLLRKLDPTLPNILIWE